MKKVKDQTVDAMDSNKALETLEAAMARIAELEAQLEFAKKAVKNAKSNKEGPARKQQAIDLLINKGPLSVLDMASELGITSKNVSSVLTAIRHMGYDIHTNGAGQKYIAGIPAVTEAEEPPAEEPPAEEPTE